MSTSGMFNTSGGYHDKCGGYHEYIGGCSVHRRDTMSTSGGYQGSVIFYQEGGLLKIGGDQYFV